ncbi:MAG: TolC family protein [Rubrivivax sp.]
MALAAPPAGEPLTLSAALAAAESRSMALPAQTAAALAARERAVAAGQRPDPVLRLGLDNVPIQGGTEHILTREPTTARSIGIVQALPDSAKRQARTRRFEQDARVADARRQAVLGSLRRETALAWLAAWAEMRRLSLIDEQRSEAERTQAAAEAAYRAGRGPQTDLFVTRSALARLADRRLQAEAAALNARSTLRRWVGNAADRPLENAAGKSPGLLSDGALPTAQWLTTLAAGDPELQLAAAREAAARSMADVASEERRADWSVDLRFAQRGPRYDNMVTLGVSIPLRWNQANLQDRELAARLAEVEQARTETEELRRIRTAEAERWLQSLRAGWARLQNLDHDLLPLAASRTEAALSAYRSGSGSLQAVFDARQAEVALRLDRLQIELDTASEQARLDTLVVPTVVPATAPLGVPLVSPVQAPLEATR